MNIKNYWFILILPANSKVLHKLMSERFYSIFVKKNMFYSKQFGFGSKRSIIDDLAETTEQVRPRSTDTFTCIKLDLRKAFDSIK